MYKTPDEDVGFWYQNLKVSLEQLQSLPPNCSELEKSNMLIKLRETLLDHGESAENTTSPDGISIFPNNNGWLMFGLLSFLAAIGGIILFNVGLDEY